MSAPPPPKAPTIRVRLVLGEKTPKREKHPASLKDIEKSLRKLGYTRYTLLHSTSIKKLDGKTTEVKIEKNFRITLVPMPLVQGKIPLKIRWLRGKPKQRDKQGKKDKFKVMATLGEGELIGEMSFFDKSVRSATVITKGPVEALVFSKENFQEIFAASPQWTNRLLVSLSSRIRLMMDKLREA